MKTDTRTSEVWILSESSSPSLTIRQRQAVGERRVGHTDMSDKRHIAHSGRVMDASCSVVPPNITILKLLNASETASSQEHGRYCEFGWSKRMIDTIEFTGQHWQTAPIVLFHRRTQCLSSLLLSLHHNDGG